MNTHTSRSEKAIFSRVIMLCYFTRSWTTPDEDAPALYPYPPNTVGLRTLFQQGLTLRPAACDGGGEERIQLKSETERVEQIKKASRFPCVGCANADTLSPSTSIC